MVVTSWYCIHCSEAASSIQYGRKPNTCLRIPFGRAALAARVDPTGEPASESVVIAD